MLKIKLTRKGKRNQPSYRIVVVEAKSKRDGKYVESIGHYNPLTEPATVEYDKKRLNYWILRGAQPTKTVRNLVKGEENS